MKNIYRIIVIFSCFSCQNGIENDLIGYWEIRSVTINNEPVIYDLLTYNFTLKQNHTCHLPILEISDWRNKSHLGEWVLSSRDNKNYLTIHSSNIYFGKEFLINYIKTIDLGNKQKTYEMKITCDSTSFYMGKFF